MADVEKDVAQISIENNIAQGDSGCDNDSSDKSRKPMSEAEIKSRLSQRALEYFMFMDD